MITTPSLEVSKIIVAARATMFVEGLRRWILILGLFLAAVFATWTDFHPYFAVTEPSKWDLADLQNQPVEAAADSTDRLVAAGSGSEKKLPLAGVSGAEWEPWFASVQKSFHGGQVPDNWLHRLTKDEVRDVKRFKEHKTSFEPSVRRLIFGQDEAPLAALFSGKKQGEELIVGLNKGKDTPQYLKVYYSAAPYLRGLGSGIYGVPDTFSYPLRHLWYMPLAIMLALYLILPWPASGKNKNVCSYKRWQIILSDFAGCLLYGMFMALPLLIVGGTVQALTDFAGFTAIFWGLASLGLCCLWWSYFYAVYRIHMLDDQLVFACPSAVKAVPYADMNTLELVRIVPPKWLIIATLLTASRRQAGRTLLLASSSSVGICIGTSAGDAFYVWITNSMGQKMLSNLDLLISKLNVAPARDLPEMRELEAIFPPIMEAFSRRKTSKLIKFESQTESLLERASRAMKEQSEQEDENEDKQTSKKQLAGGEKSNL